MKKRGPNVLYDLNDLLFFLTLISDVVAGAGCLGLQSAWPGHDYWQSNIGYSLKRAYTQD